MGFPDLPTHSEFEYVRVEEDGRWVWMLIQYECTGYEEESESFIWTATDQQIYFQYEEDLIAYVQRNGVFAENFKARLN